MDTLYKTNPNYVARTISGLTVVVPISEDCPKFNGMMKLGGVGEFLWNYFSVAHTIKEACDELIGKYDTTEDVVSSDVAEFVDSLMQYGLLTVVEV